ncbi:MAG: putative sugar phosphate isomerase YwlF [Firmicutes bacterium]|nr:putative sugar phosphate isomerase YwlF [candidate division NPL-UPA2 bacterium]
MKISLGSDHAGLALKQEIFLYLKRAGHTVLDRGTSTDASVDYPDFAASVCNDIKSDEAERGILVCGTGIGMSIAANKHAGIRAALCHDTFSARATREHNDANVLCLGQRVIGAGLALDIVAVWLGAEFAGDKHLRRLEKIARLEKH